MSSFWLFLSWIKYKLVKLDLETKQESKWDLLKLCLRAGHFLLQEIKFHGLSESFQICFNDEEMKTFYTDCI